jgi:hypothetical protein
MNASIPQIIISPSVDVSESVINYYNNILLIELILPTSVLILDWPKQKYTWSFEINNN